MSFFPPEFDPRADVAFKLDLVNVNTPDGDFGFILGADGAFRDINGKRWVGSTLIGAGDDEVAIGGTAPEGALTLTFFQDPEEEDFVAQIKGLGADYVAGRPVTFHVQPLRSQAEFLAPTLAPITVMTRTARKVIFGLEGPLKRSMTLTYESVFEARKLRRARVYNTEDHARLVGSANPSLQYIPTSQFRDEPVFG